MHQTGQTGQPATYPRYVAAKLTTGAYVVYDRWAARVADGAYLSLVDAQWAADQRNYTGRQGNQGSQSNG